MKIQKKTLINGFKLLAVILVSGIVSFTGLNKLQAQETIPMQITPVRNQLTISPGETTSFVVKFYNLGDTPLTGTIKAVDFIVDNLQGKVRLLDDDKLSSKFSAASWITLPFSQLTIAPNDVVLVQANITVPKDVRAGGRYAALYFETEANAPTNKNDQQVGSSVANRIASLVYIRIPGPITESAMISRLYANSFLEYGPIDVETQIANRGDYHITPKGVIKLTNLTGGIVEQVALKEQNVFPDSAREYQNTIGQKLMFGRFKINLDASYGDRGQVMSRFIYVWIIPFRLLSVILLTLLILIIVVRRTSQASKEQLTTLETELEKEKQEVSELKKILEKKKD